MKPDKIELMVGSDYARAWVNFLIVHTDEDGNECYGYGYALQAKEAEGEIITPTFSMDRRAVQQLVDDLWHQGIRPTSYQDATQALKATQAHLADMREIVFHEEDHTPPGEREKPKWTITELLDLDGSHDGEGREGE